MDHPSVRYRIVAALLAIGILVSAPTLSHAACEKSAQADCLEITTDNDEVVLQPWQIHYPSARAALLLSLLPTLVGTAVGGGLIGFGLSDTGYDYFMGFFSVGAFLAGISLTAGPAVGHFYAKNKLWGGIGSGLRFVSAGMLVGGAVMTYLSEWCSEEPCPGRRAAGIALLAVGAVALTGLIGLDIATARRAVRRLREKEPPKPPKVLFRFSASAVGLGPSLWGSF